MMRKLRLNKRQALIVRWGTLCAVAALTLGIFAVAGSARKDPAAPNVDGSITGLTNVLERVASEEQARFSFHDVTPESGVQFRHFPARRGSVLPEDMGSGLAWGDYDADGDPDLFLVNFCGSLIEPPLSKSGEGGCRLFRNDGEGRFADVTGQAGLGASLYGMGAAWGDFDNDDDLDLYVTAYGPNVLYENCGDGTFVDATDAAGVGDPRFSSGCAWGDYDGDGNIDLYVCNYVDFELRPRDDAGRRQRPGIVNPSTINPSAYAPVANALYRNRGDGTFYDVAEEAGVADPQGRSLSAVWFDFDDDGRIDLYVANDVSANGVFHNQGNGAFVDIGAQSLAADYRGAMGLAVGDYEGDGDFDLFVTHWVAQENAFFENMFINGGASPSDNKADRPLYFTDISDRLGLGQSSLQMIGWATSFVDFDNDGNLDLWVVNGSTLQLPDDPTQLEPQRPLIYRQQPPRGFYEVGILACPRLAQPIVGRGGADADFDGDGRVDLAIAVHGGQPILLRNTTAETGRWLSVRLRQVGGNTRALGAIVTVRAAGRVQRAQVGADGAYLSQRAGDLHFGLGSAERVDEIIIRWPDGKEDRHCDVSPDQVVELRH